MPEVKQPTYTFRSCPTCGAKPGEPCRTPKGVLKKVVHDTRPFDVWIPEDMLPKKESEPNNV